MIFKKTLNKALRDQLRSQQIILFIFFLSLLILLFVAMSKVSFTGLDIYVNSWTASIQTSSATQIAEIIDFVFDTPALLTITLLVAVYLFYRNYRVDSLLLVVAMAGGAVILAAIKMVVHSARPLNELIFESGFSFPSGHASGSVIFCGLITFFGCRHWKSSKAKISLSMISVIVTFIVGFDRIYLNVHWFSDVLGGCFLGIFWLVSSILAFQYAERKRKLSNKTQKLS